MIKGEIWWACLPNPRGSEPGKTRPVVIIQSDAINKSAIQTCICAIITSNVALMHAPGNILLETAESKLDKTSVINISQIITIDKSFLTSQVSMLSKSMITKIDNSIKIVFNIE